MHCLGYDAVYYHLLTRKPLTLTVWVQVSLSLG